MTNVRGSVQTVIGFEAHGRVLAKDAARWAASFVLEDYPEDAAQRQEVRGEEESWRW